jgi:Na+-transporting methylmalonyl-CoA/oxaloacetate decarboxylase gamma subunit
MKKLILVLSFIIGLGFMASAQVNRKSPEQRAARHTKELQKRLNLSQEQALQVHTAFLTMATRMDSLKNNLSADKKGKQLAAQRIRLETKKQVAAVLNEGQKQKFATWEKMRKEKHMEKKAPTAIGQG